MHNNPAKHVESATGRADDGATPTRVSGSPSRDEAMDRAMAEVVGDHVVALLAVDHMNPYEFAIACEVFGIRRGELLARMDQPRWYDLRVCGARPGQALSSAFGPGRPRTGVRTSSPQPCRYPA